MLVKEKNGVYLHLDRCLSGDHVWTVSGKGIERLRWYGYQNAYHAENYFNKCVDTKYRNSTE